MEGLDDAEPDVVLSGKGLFDSPTKEVTVSLTFMHKEISYHCVRNVDAKWFKAERHFVFKMPKLSWLIGDHQITP